MLAQSTRRGCRAIQSVRKRRRNQVRFSIHLRCEVTHCKIRTYVTLFSWLLHLPQECASKLHAIRSPLGPVKLDPNSEKSPRDFSVSWESPEGDGISPLRFDSSPKEMFRHKENVNAQLQQSFSASKGFRNSCNKSVASNEKPGAHSHGDAKQVPKARANVVSARRVVSTRLTHQVRHHCEQISVFWPTAW